MQAVAVLSLFFIIALFFVMKREVFFLLLCDSQNVMFLQLLYYSSVTK